MSFNISSFELPRVWAIDNKNDVLFNVDGTIAFRRWNQKARAMEIYLSMSRLEAEKLLLCLQAAQHNAHLTLGSRPVFCVCCGGEVSHPVCTDCLPSPAQVA